MTYIWKFYSDGDEHSDAYEELPIEADSLDESAKAVDKMINNGSFVPKFLYTEKDIWRMAEVSEMMPSQFKREYGFIEVGDSYARMRSVEYDGQELPLHG